MAKLQRNYILTVQVEGGSTITIRPPFTVEFDVQRNYFSSANVSSIRIINLSERTRSLIVKNQNDYFNFKSVDFKAGYGNNLSTVFSGNISQAWSVREGTEFVTNIEAFDGGFAFANARIDRQYSDTTERSVLLDMAESMGQYHVQTGAIGNYPGEVGRSNSYSGKTTDVMREISGNGMFIDNNTVNCLNDNECLAGEIPVVNASTGLLGTPVRENTYYNFDVLFNPTFKINQRINLVSDTLKSSTGLYKIISIHHRGIISEAVSGVATTSLGVLRGEYIAVEPEVQR